MANDQTTFTMTADQLKAVINKTLSNAAEGKTNNQTNLNDAVRLLGVDGNWGTALSKDMVVAPGAGTPAPQISPPMPAEVDVYLNIYDNDGKVNVEIRATQDEADRAVEAELKKSYKREYPDVDFNLSCDELIEALREESDYAVNVTQERLSMKLPSQDTPKQKAQTLSNEERIRQEEDLIARDEVDYITCRFLAQAWFRDNAMAVDPEGDTLWHMTAAEALDLSGCKTIAELEADDGYATDQLRQSIHAPEWTKEWSGPYEIGVCEVKLTKDNRPMARAEELVWNAARDAYEMVAEGDQEIEEQLHSLDLDDEAKKKLFDDITQEWWDAHAGLFVWGVEVDGTGKVTDHVVDESWGLLRDKLEEMTKTKEDKDTITPSM